MTDARPPADDRRPTLLVALAVALIVVLLRAPFLDRLGLHADEDISTLAGRAIAAAGVPELPSGHLYFRAPAYHYLLAPFTAPGVDWRPRILSVALAAITGVLLVLRGGALAGHRAAVVAGLLYAVSLVEISNARAIRMYSLFQPLALVAILLVHRFWVTGALRWGWLAAAAMLLAFTTHELAVTLALLFIPVAVRHATTRHWTFAIVATAGFLLLLRVSNRLLGDFFRAGLPPAGEPPSPGLAGLPGLAFRTMQADDPLAFARAVLGGAGTAAAAVGAAAIAVWLALRATRGRPALRRATAAGTLAVALAAAAMGHIALAGALLAMIALQRADLLPDRPGARTLAFAAFGVVGLGAVWLVLGVAHGYAPLDTAIGLIQRPGRLMRLLFWPPALTVLAVAGALIVARDAWRGAPPSGRQFTLITLLWIIVARGTLGDRVQIRYLADVWPLASLLGGIAVVALLDRLRAGSAPAAAGHAAATPRTLGAGVTLAAVVLLVPGTRPADIYTFLARGPGDRSFTEQRLDSPAADLRGACAWLLPRLQPGERVAATDWLATRCYLPRVDGWLRGSEYGWQTVRGPDGIVRDCYIGAQLLPDLDALFDFAAEGPVWVVAGGQELMGFGAPLADDVRAWLLARPAEFTAADGETRVYRVGPLAR